MSIILRYDCETSEFPRGKMIEVHLERFSHSACQVSKGRMHRFIKQSAW